MKRKEKPKMIFLISQPRCGSTLLQKILGSHSEIYTRSEPWLMLHFAYSLKDEGIYTDYNFDMFRRGISDFIFSFPEGRQDFIKEIREICSNLYRKHMDNQAYFLDKTPRYYLIVEELKEIFPDAKFIIIIRNPLAVLNSIVQNWTKNNWFRLSEYKYDLLKGIEVISEYCIEKNKNIFCTKFEDLINDSEEIVRKICEFLELEFEPEMLQFFNKNQERWLLGDQKIYEMKGIVKTVADNWVENLTDPQTWRVLHDYLHFIGKEKLRILGYDYGKMVEILNGNMPSDTRLELFNRTFDLFSMLENAKDCLIDNFRLKNQIKENIRLLNLTNRAAQEKVTINRKDISIVLGTYNRLFFLQVVIEGIRKELRKMNIRSEIIVVDGGSTDGTMGWLMRQKDIVTIVQHNRGFWDGKYVKKRSWGYFMNLGFKASQGKYICMLSDDALIIPGAIKNGYQFFEDCLNSGEKLGAAAFYFRDYPVRKRYGVAINLGNLYVNHGIFLREAVEEAGYISEDEYEFYFADTDLALKIKQRGYSCLISENSYVEHYFDSNDSLRQSNNNDAKNKDRLKLINKWEGIAFPKDETEHFLKSVGYWQYTDYTDSENTINLLLEAGKRS